MSSVRMCDRCGAVFSELTDGWQTYTATTIKKVPGSAKRESVTAQLDACPACSMDTENVESPAAGRQDDAFFARKALEQENATLKERLESLQPAAPEEPAPAS